MSVPTPENPDMSLISFQAWRGEALARGECSQGAQLSQSLGYTAITLQAGTQEGNWTSDLFRPETPFTRAVASWQAQTPGQSSIETQLQVVSTDGRESGWYNLGRWASTTTVQEDGSFTSKRASGGEQADEIGSVDQDTFWMNDDAQAVAYRLRCILRGDGDDVPAVRQLAAVTSEYPGNNRTETSPTTMKEAIKLAVPRLSQYLHENEYPQLDTGGAAWCSPTSVAMVLRYYGCAPTQQEIASLPRDAKFDANNRRDGDVAYAAYHTFDNHNPDKDTGNWPFNTAYAASRGLDASVHQYSSLQRVEEWIKQGVPVIVTINWNNDEKGDPAKHLTGASIKATGGHLMVVIGFTKEGDVIANDPAAPSNEQVEHAYCRDQFERLWLRAKGGTAYIIKRHAAELPKQ